MRALPVMLVVAALGIPLIPAASPADDLSELAAREKGRRKGKEGKVYTEEDLKKKDEVQREQNRVDGNKPDDGDMKVTFNFPTDGSTVYNKVPLNVRVTPYGNLDAVLYSINNQALGKGNGGLGYKTRSWDTTALPAGSYTIKAEARDKAGHLVTSKVTVTVSKTVNVDPVVASCKRSTAVPASGVFGMDNAFGEDQRAIAEMKTLGLQWVRRDFAWEDIELVQGQYDWWYPDMVMTTAHENGLQVLALPNSAPKWLDKKEWPERYAAFRSFMQVLVDRYKPGGVFAQKSGWTDGYGVSYWESGTSPIRTDGAGPGRRIQSNTP